LVLRPMSRQYIKLFQINCPRYVIMTLLRISKKGMSRCVIWSLS
jgi:hypothetical protein